MKYIVFIFIGLSGLILGCLFNKYVNRQSEERIINAFKEELKKLKP